MEDQPSLLERAGETFGYLQQYVEKQLELYQLEITERVVQLLSSLITYFLLLTIFGLVVLFGSMAAAFYLAAAFGSQGLGFLIVMGIYALLAVLLFVFRRQVILNPVLQMVLGSMQGNDKPEDQPSSPPADQPTP